MPWILVYDQTTSRPCFDCRGKSPCSAWIPLNKSLTPELLHCVCIADEGNSTETQTLKNLKWHRGAKKGMNVFYSFSHCADKRFPFMWNPKSVVLSQKHTKPGTQANITYWKESDRHSICYKTSTKGGGWCTMRRPIKCSLVFGAVLGTCPCILK